MRNLMAYTWNLNTLYAKYAKFAEAWVAYFKIDDHLDIGKRLISDHRQY